MKENYLLISGRPGSGKTEMLICYANQFPEKTLILSNEYSKQTIQKRGLDTNVEVTDQNGYDKINILEFDTICIDYIEVFEKNFIANVIKEIINLDIRIIAVSQMSRSDYSVLNNVFEETKNLLNIKNKPLNKK
jgi:predicted ATP-dependent serine protease